MVERKKEETAGDLFDGLGRVASDAHKKKQKNPPLEDGPEWNDCGVPAQPHTRPQCFINNGRTFSQSQNGCWTGNSTQVALYLSCVFAPMGV